MRLRPDQNDSNFSKKIQIGFGPTGSRATHYGVQAYRIDPIITEINRVSRRFEARKFKTFKDRLDFDLVLVVKDFDDITSDILTVLGNRKCKIVYDIVDNPLGNKKSYLDHPTFLNCTSAIIISNPLQKGDLPHYHGVVRLIEHPYLNTLVKTIYTADSIKVVWQGFYWNMKYVKHIEPIIEQMNYNTSVPIELWYHTNWPLFKNFTGPKWRKLIRFTEKNRFSVLKDSDIGITAKDLGDPCESRKPSTKLLTYMAGGLPSVCTPSAADVLVGEHKNTTFFAFNLSEWKKYLKILVHSQEERRRMGSAARQSVSFQYSVEKITEKYLALFETLMEEGGKYEK